MCSDRVLTTSLLFEVNCSEDKQCVVLYHSKARSVFSFNAVTRRIEITTRQKSNCFLEFLGAFLNITTQVLVLSISFVCT